jgi:formylglycine-generating enzyme required for sulfatase activity
MGSDTGQSDERPVHEVFLSPFELSSHQVTHAEYAGFLRDTDWPTPKQWCAPGLDNPAGPACGVSWVDAVRYCMWLNESSGAAADGMRYHLPTEAQLEYAGRGGVAGAVYPWGDAEPPRRGYYARGLEGPKVGRPMAVGTVAWWPAHPADGIGPAPGPFGLHNLADNVHEWCADYYARDYYASSPRRDPPGPAASDRRVATAGSWRHDLKFAPNAARSSLSPVKRFTDFGFRVARSAGFAYVFCDADPSPRILTGDLPHPPS